MVTVNVRREIAAPVEDVFGTVADIDRFSAILPHSVKVEHLNGKKTGIGAKFRETRVMGKQENVNEFEITEYIENERVRMIADTNGTVWDTLFEVREEAGKTTIDVEMDARPHKLLPKLLNPLMKGLFRKGIEKDMDLLKEALETGNRDEVDEED
ncbi:MAG: SRPBCC family protein [Pyrinomonadaceae bacterium]|nr:SRPBCC family protein [Pyrinomonadaceae bacterium]